MACNVLTSLHQAHDGQRAEIVHQGLLAAGQRHLEIGAGFIRAVGQNLHRRNIALVARDHARQLVQDAGAAAGVDHDPDGLSFHVSSQCSGGQQGSATRDPATLIHSGSQNE